MLDIVRGLVRPIATMLILVAVLAFIPLKVEVTDRLWDLAFMVLGFWFGSRKK